MILQPLEYTWYSYLIKCQLPSLCLHISPHCLGTRLACAWQNQTGPWEGSVLEQAASPQQWKSNYSGWTRLHIFPLRMHIVWAPGLGVHGKKPGRALRRSCFSAGSIKNPSNSNTFRSKQAGYFPIAHAHHLGTRLECSWKQAGRALKRPCSNAGLIIITVKTQLLQDSEVHKHTQRMPAHLMFLLGLYPLYGLHQKQITQISVLEIWHLTRKTWTSVSAPI